LLELINDLTNGDIAQFHRDNYLSFKDFSAELKRNEIYSKIEEYKKTANLTGY